MLYVYLDLVVQNLSSSILETRLERTIIRAEIQLGVMLSTNVANLLLNPSFVAPDGALLSLEALWAE